MDRYQGVGDQRCSCGTEYNIGGQRLRSNWRENASSFDDDLTDLDGYELALAAAESVL